MQNSKHPLMKKLGKKLKKYLKIPLVLDIFLIGSSIKEKPDPKDIDLIILLKERDYRMIEDLFHSIKKELAFPVHIEPLFIDAILQESIFSSVIHEGISLKYQKNVSNLLGYKSFLLFTFSLQNLKNIDKVRFAQTIYGRKGDGILQQERGISLGKGAFLIPVEKEYLFREIMQKFKAHFEVKRIFVKD